MNTYEIITETFISTVKADIIVFDKLTGQKLLYLNDTLVAVIPKEILIYKI